MTTRLVSLFGNCFEEFDNNLEETPDVRGNDEVAWALESIRDLDIDREQQSNVEEGNVIGEVLDG